VVDVSSARSTSHLDKYLRTSAWTCTAQYPGFEGEGW
jgi:hypothetical protein